MAAGIIGTGRPAFKPEPESFRDPTQGRQGKGERLTTAVILVENSGRQSVPEIRRTLLSPPSLRTPAEPLTHLGQRLFVARGKAKMT